MQRSFCILFKKESKYSMSAASSGRVMAMCVASRVQACIDAARVRGARTASGKQLRVTVLSQMTSEVMMGMQSKPS